MSFSPRDRISVDLRGLKQPLLRRSEVLGISPSDLVRSCLERALGEAAEDRPSELSSSRRPPGARVRLCLRMSAEDASAVTTGARAARVSVGDYVSALVANVPAVAAGSRGESIAALMASSAELATLGRNVHRLTTLLRQVQVEPARRYREMLDTLVGDVHRHLELAASVLADLQPQRVGTAQHTARHGV